MSCRPFSLSPFVRRAAVLAAGPAMFFAGPAQAAENAVLKLEKIAEGFVSPVGLVPYPGDDGLLVVLDQAGTAWLLGPDGKRLAEPFLDLRSKVAKLNEGFDERGLLGLAFHPKFSENGRIFVYYSGPLRDGAPDRWDHTSVLAEFRVKKGEQSVDLASEKVVLQIDEPQFNHNSGKVLFGPDGLLYVSTGDGGGANDAGPGHVPGGNAQDPEQLLGKILRIDVDRGDPYGIPDDNPFAGRDGRDEIFALGLRNPWGLSFMPDGRLVLADIGQNRFEEVNVIEKGGNYGWNIREGFSGFDPEKAMDAEIEKPTVDAAGKAFAEPVLVYKNPKAFPADSDARGASICGGYVYRGQAIPWLRDRYVFGDWTFIWGLGKGSLFSAKTEGTRWELEPLPVEGAANGQIDAFMLAIGEGPDGELYILTNKAGGLTGETGVVWKLVQG